MRLRRTGLMQSMKESVFDSTNSPLMKFGTVPPWPVTSVMLDMLRETAESWACPHHARICTACGISGSAEASRWQRRGTGGMGLAFGRHGEGVRVGATRRVPSGS